MAWFPRLKKSIDLSLFLKIISLLKKKQTAVGETLPSNLRQGRTFTPFYPARASGLQEKVPRSVRNLASIVKQTAMKKLALNVSTLELRVGGPMAQAFEQEVLYNGSKGQTLTETFDPPESLYLRRRYEYEDRRQGCLNNVYICYLGLIRSPQGICN